MSLVQESETARELGAELKMSSIEPVAEGCCVVCCPAPISVTALHEESTITADDMMANPIEGSFSVRFDTLHSHHLCCLAIWRSTASSPVR